MRRPFVVVVVVVDLLTVSVLAQRATEMLIPIGKSPGVSGVTTAIGTIAACDATGGLQVTSERGSQTAALAAETKIWLDGSASKRAHAVGTLADCQKGRRAEVKYVYDGPTRTDKAEWIKIALE
jgi:hypothetical protein